MVSEEGRSEMAEAVPGRLGRNPERVEGEPKHAFPAAESLCACVSSEARCGGYFPVLKTGRAPEAVYYAGLWTTIDLNGAGKMGLGCAKNAGALQRSRMAF